MKKLMLFLGLICIVPTKLFCMQTPAPAAGEINGLSTTLAGVHLGEPRKYQKHDNAESKEQENQSERHKQRALNPYKFHVVINEELYRSAQLPLEDLDYRMTKLGIKSVINLRTKNDIPEKELVLSKKADYYHVPMCGHSLPSIKNLEMLLNIFKTAKPPILIHCQQGRDRTGEATALYLYAIKKKSKQEALKQFAPPFTYDVTLHPGKAFLIYLLPDNPDEIAQWITSTYNPYGCYWFAETQQKFQKDYGLKQLCADKAFLRSFKEGCDLQRFDLVFADHWASEAARAKELGEQNYLLI